MNQVPQVELGMRLGGCHLHTALLVTVVEHQLVMTLAIKSLGFEPGQCRRIAVQRFDCTTAVPGRAVAAGQIGFGAGMLIGGLCIDRQIAFAWGAARGGRNAAFTATVIQRLGDDRPVDVAIDEMHQHFLTNGRQTDVQRPCEFNVA